MLSMGFANRPRDDKVSDGGDDAWFITNSVINAMGVADGLGSYRRDGINAGFCAREIMDSCKDYYMDGYTNPFVALERAESQSRALGSTTALVAHFDGVMLDVGQIGDSNLIVIRDNYIKYETTSGTRYHNQPYSIGSSSSDVMEKVFKEYLFELEVGDIIVMGTDGLWDNMYPTQVLTILRDSGLKGAKGMAQVLASVAYELSNDEEMWSPFAQDAYDDGQIAQSEELTAWEGGKPDDITVVVAVVQEF